MSVEQVTRPRAISRRTAGIALVIIVALAAYLRLRGWDALLPHATQTDSRSIVRQVELIRSEVPHPETDPSWAFYSLLVPRIVASLPAADPSRARTLDEHLACAGLVLTQVRFLAILFSILAVPATYLLARHFLDRARSLFAAAVLATSMMHIILSTLEKPHAIVTTTVLLGVLAALRLLRKPTLGSYALCGISGSAAIGSLQNGLVVLPAFLTAHVLRARDRVSRRRAWMGVLLGLAIFAVGWWWLWPARSPVPRTEVGPSITLTGQRIVLSRMDGTGAVRMTSELWGADPLLVVLSAIGLAAGAIFGLARLWRSGQWRPIVVVLSVAGPYALFTGLYELTAGRYVVPLVPFLACLAAGAIPRKLAGPAFLLLIVPLAPAWKLAELRARPDTFEEVAAFITTHVSPEETVLLIPSFDVPLFTDERTTRANVALPWASPWNQYVAELDPEWIQGERYAILVMPSSGTPTPRAHVTGNLSYFDDNGARWVVAECEAGPPALRADIDTLRVQADLVARISPLVHDDKGHDLWMPPESPLHFPGPFPRAWRMFEARAVGPMFEIYRLP